MAGGKETPKEEKQEPSVRRSSKSIWPWKKETDGSASFLRAARAGNLEKVLEFLKTNTDINTCNANGLNALHLASKEGHTEVVSALLDRSANVDAATKKGNTALHIASLAGQDEIVKVLVEHGATVNIQSQNGFTPLYMAAQENHDSVVRFLLSHGANQSLATEDGFTPLAVALQQGHDRVVSVLLENDTRGKVRLPALHIAAKKDDAKAAALLLHTDHNPDITSKSGFTPLHIASHYGNDNIAGLLIQRGADVNYVAKHQITPLHVASKWGKGNMVSLLLDKGANIEAKTRDGLTPLHCAARSGHETVVDMLLEKGAPITAKTKNGLAPLHMASQGDHVDAARILLYHKAPVDDVTVDFLTALHVAAHCGHVRVAKLLLDRKADPNSRALNGFTPLHIACKKNRIKVVELLLKHGASIEATTESGLTPLHVASFMGCMNIVIYLIQHGASADVPTVRGESPLHLAARANQTDIIRILLRNGAEVDAKAREQQTALHIASRLGNTDIVGLLLQQGASVDAPTKDLYTPLHIAAKEGQEEVAGVLLDHRASLNTPTKKGFTPLHLAAKYGHLKVARLLLQREAPVDPKGKNGVTPLHVAAHYDHQNVAMLLLDKGAQPHATAKNGYTPLHIAARKNQMDIAGTLLEYGANANAESKAGFTPLHLSAQEGHTDMATLLLEHGAQPGGAAKNGLTPLHLCAQEDRVPVGAILVKHGAAVDAQTKAGYTPLHVAAHFGQMNMVKFLLQHGTKVDAPTQLGYTPLHQAAQQGHTQIVNLLLENKAQPNMETNDGKTALSIAQRLGYISVVETLKIVTETRVTTNTTTTTEEKYKVVVPETMHETFMSESEDEGADDTMLGDQSYRYLTVDEMKSLGDDSLPIDVTRDEKMDVSFQSNLGAAPGEHISPQHKKEALYAQNYPTDNIDVGKAPILAGPESLNTTMNTTFNPPEDDAPIVNDESRTEVPDQGTTQKESQIPATVTPTKTTQNEEVANIWDQFLVSFMVDARGGAMRGCRHSGVRVIIPPRKAAMPMRITCRYLKKDKLVHAPPLMEGEALSSRILEMGPSGAKFLGPVIIEVPHFASLRGKEREIVILRSDNGETWREHTLEATEEAVQEVLNESFDGEELKQLEDLNTNRITRILTTDFPQYFAIVTRIRQEVHAIGPEGGMVSSTVVPQVQAVFPQGALTKKIKVGLQAQPISTDLVAKLLGNRVAVSPIVTVEPRRRKFHKPITLTIPVPQAASKGMINQYSGEAPTLRLLCSITGGTTRAQWEDVTGSTPLTFVNDCVSFTTTVSARFWLMDCTNIPEATKMATELYREAIHVPFMAKFVVFSKRHQLEEARVRVFCMTDDKEDKTLESQEHFIEVAKSRDVEVLEGKSQYLEFAGNLIPVTKSGDQLAFNFYAFRENRLPFTVRVKDQNAETVGRVAFMRQPKVGRGEAPQNPICTLNLSLPDNIQPEPAPSEPDLLALEKKYAFLSISKADTIHKADLRLSDISNMLASDWVALAKELDISDSDINIIKTQYPDNTPQQAIVMLRLWMQTSGNIATGNTLEKALRAIHRDDIVEECICNMEIVTDVSEKATAEEVLEKKPQGNLVDEIIPAYDEKDIMKDAESVEEEEIAHKTETERLKEKDERLKEKDETYETEERKYAAEEKIVKEIEENLLHKEKYPVKEETFKGEKHSPKTDEKYPKEEKLPKDEKKLPKEDKRSPKDDKKSPADDKNYIKEEIISKKEKIISEIKSEETIKKKGNDIEIERKEESVKETKEEKREEKREKSQEKKIYEKKEEEKEVLEEKKVEERQHFFTVPQEDKPKPTSTTTTTLHTASEDGTVTEHITVEKRTSTASEVPKPAKEELLQKLGEELGKLDEKLEEKFKEKNKEKLADGLTQPSAETSQMEAGQAAPSDVKPPTASEGEPPTTDLQLADKVSAVRSYGENIELDEDTFRSRITDRGYESEEPFELISKGDVLADDLVNVPANIVGKNWHLETLSESSQHVTTDIKEFNSSGIQALQEGLILNGLSHTAHRPTTLKISYSDEVDENESNDSCFSARENEFISQNQTPVVIKQMDCNVIEKETSKKDATTAQGNHLSSVSYEVLQRPEEVTDMAPRIERSARPSSRSTILKVKVERRPATNHSSKEKSSFGLFKENLQSLPQVSSAILQNKSQNTSIEDEVIGLMAEVQEVTQEIKKDVKRLRDSESPTPETPTPLREFRDFLCKEEEQESTRLPTICEIGKEAEEEGPTCGITGEMASNLTYKNHIGTFSLFANKMQCKSNINNTNLADVSQNKNISKVSDDTSDAFPCDVNSNNLNSLDIKTQSPKSVIGLEIPRNNNSSNRFRAVARSLVNPVYNRASTYSNSKLGIKSYDTLSNFSNDKNSVSFNRSCYFCTRDLLLNDVCNDLSEIISFVEQGVRLSKKLNTDVLISSLDNLKYKLGSVFDESDELSVINKESSHGICNIENSGFKSINKPEVVNKSDCCLYKSTESKILTMPSVKDGELDPQPLLLVPNVTSEVDGQDYLTDVEELSPEGASPHLLKKINIQVDAHSDDDKVTDIEDLENSDFDDDADTKIDEEIPIDNFLPDQREVLNFTEGYARESSPLMSEGEHESVDIEKRHLRNVKVISLEAEDLGLEDVVQDLTDEEIMADVINEQIEIEKEEEGSILPDHYLQEDDSVSKHEVVTSVSSDSKKEGVKKSLSDQKQNLQIHAEIEEKTDIEDLEAESNISMKKPKRKKPRSKKSKSLSCPPSTLTPDFGTGEGLTDIEILLNSSDSSSDGYVEGFDERYLAAVREFKGFTDTEDMNISDMDERDLLSSPIPKDEPTFIFEPIPEKINISERIDKEFVEDIQDNTDEEGFYLDEKEDKKPSPFSANKYPPPHIVAHHSDSGESEDVLTDTDDVHIEEKDDEDIINDYIQRLPKEDSNVLLEMQSESAANLIDEIKKMETKPVEIPSLLVNEEGNDALTDIEEWDDKGGVKPVKMAVKSKGLKNKSSCETDSENVEDSEEEKIPRRKYKKIIGRSQTLPIVSLSEFKFVESESSPLRIIVTPDTAGNSNKIEDSIKSVIFLEDENEALTDIEEIGTPGDEKKLEPAKVEDIREQVTDTEDFESQEPVSDRPPTPLPPESIELPSPRREKIYIVEDEFGVPHVKIENLDETATDIAEEENQVDTDTDDVDIPENEIPLVINSEKDIEGDSFTLLEVGLSEVSSKLKTKICRQLKAGEAPLTDEEEILCGRKGKRKNKLRKRFLKMKVDEERDTDLELLNEDDESLLSNPVVEAKVNTSGTDCEYFESSGEYEPRQNVLEAAPKFVHIPGITQVVRHTEQNDGSFKVEIIDEKDSNTRTAIDDPKGATDTENVDISEAEEVYEGFIPKDAPSISLPTNEESNVSVSVKAFSLASRRGEADEETKENLLLPEAGHTDVESLDEGEEIGEHKTKIDDSSKPEASVKSPLMEVDLSVLDSLLTSQEAETEEMSSSPETKLKVAQPEINVDNVEHLQSKVQQKIIIPKTDTQVKSAPPPPPPRTIFNKEWPSNYNDHRKRESSELSEHLSSDDAEDQLALMKDSPRWEDEEIKAEDPVAVRPIKAEIKLMVKTTEVGKESIEIRSIREFVDSSDKPTSALNVDDKKDSNSGEVKTYDDKVSAYPRQISHDKSTSSSKFVRPEEKYSSLYEEESDDFDLLAQVRDCQLLGPSTIDESYGEMSDEDDDPSLTTVTETIAPSFNVNITTTITSSKTTTTNTMSSSSTTCATTSVDSDVGVESTNVTIRSSEERKEIEGFTMNKNIKDETLRNLDNENEEY